MKKIIIAAVLLGGLYWMSNRKKESTDKTKDPQDPEKISTTEDSIVLKYNCSEVKLTIEEVGIAPRMTFLEVVAQFDNRIVIDSDGVICYVKNNKVAQATEQFIADFLSYKPLPALSIDFALWHFVTNSKRPDLIFTV